MMLSARRNQPGLDERRFAASAGSVDHADAKGLIWVAGLDPGFPEVQTLGQPVFAIGTRQQLEKEPRVLLVERAQALGHDAGRVAGIGRRAGANHTDVAAAQPGPAEFLQRLENLVPELLASRRGAAGLAKVERQFVLVAILVEFPELVADQLLEFGRPARLLNRFPAHNENAAAGAGGNGKLLQKCIQFPLAPVRVLGQVILRHHDDQHGRATHGLADHLRQRLVAGQLAIVPKDLEPPRWLAFLGPVVLFEHGAQGVVEPRDPAELVVGLPVADEHVVLESGDVSHTANRDEGR